MDFRTVAARRHAGVRLGIAAADAAADVAVKAAFLYNFAKFAEWPALLPAARLVVCVIGSDPIAAALVETVHGQEIGGHPVEIWRPLDGGSWRSCNVVFVADAQSRQLAKGLVEIKTLPILTVGDWKGFSQSGGVIELYLEGGKMRFAINLDAAEYSGIHLSSRLLALAKIIRSGHVQ
jgi:hypothetical protein